MVVGGRAEIAVEQAVGGGAPPVVQKIHHWKGEVIENVDRGDQGIELDRVEQHRFCFDQHDIGQMQIAMAAPHKTLFAAPLEQGADRGKCRARGLVEAIDLRVRKAASGTECRAIVGNDRWNRMDPGFCRGRRRRRMRGCDCVRGGGDEIGIGCSGFGQMIEGLALVETGHLHRVFHRRALAVDRKRSVGALRDRNDAAIDLRRKWTADLEARPRKRPCASQASRNRDRESGPRA